jgi:hypothetical protein
MGLYYLLEGDILRVAKKELTMYEGQYQDQVEQYEAMYPEIYSDELEDQPTHIPVKDKSQAYQLEWLTFRDMPGYRTVGNWVEV